MIKSTPISYKFLQIWVLTSAFYVFYLGLLFPAFWFTQRKSPAVLAIFTDTAYDPVCSDMHASLIRCLTLWASSLPLAWVVKTVVEHSSHCLPFIFYVFVLHLMMTTIYSQLPTDLNWYLAFGLHASGCAVVAEMLCDRQAKVSHSQIE
jgi:hypothetical protein